MTKRESERGRMGTPHNWWRGEQNVVAFLDVEIESWRRAAKVRNLLVDEESRRQGRVTELIERAKVFAREKDCRAIFVETQTTNWPALNFYPEMGYQICAIDDHFCTNRDLQRKEVALFLWREL